MAQMVQQIAPRQAAPAQTGQSAAKPAQDTDTFQSLIAAAKAGGKNSEAPDAGGKPEKTGKRETGGKETTGPDSGQAIPTAVILPFAATSAEFPQTALFNDTAALQELFPAAETASADSSLPLDGSEDAPAAAAPTTPAFKNNIPAQGGLKQKPETADVQNPAVPVVSETSPKAEGSEAPAAAAQAGFGKTQKPTESGPKEKVAEGSATVEVNHSETSEPVQTDPVKTKAPDADSQGEKPEARALVKGEQPQKKAEAEENGAQTRSLTDLYAGGNVVIKISDAKAAQKSTAAGQVAQAVTRQIKQGRQEFQIELYPQSLGKVSVRLSAENGVLTVEIAASNPKTQSMLLSGSDEIRSLLQNSTGQNVNVVRPEQAGGWYSRQDGGGNEGSGDRRQEREEEKNSKFGNFRDITSVGAGMNTSSFLSILRQFAQ